MSIQWQTRVRKGRTERPATLKTMSFVVAVEQIPYRLESQEQTLFEALAQRGGDYRFKGPFGAYQKKWCRDCHLSSKKCSDKLSSKTRKGSSEFRGETPIKWSTFGCLVHKISGEAMKQGIKVPYITFWLKLAAAKQRLNQQIRRSAWSGYQELIPTSLPQLPSYSLIVTALALAVLSAE